jgi:hypothetical protein
MDMDPNLKIIEILEDGEDYDKIPSVISSLDLSDIANAIWRACDAILDLSSAGKEEEEAVSLAYERVVRRRVNGLFQVLKHLSTEQIKAFPKDTKEMILLVALINKRIESIFKEKIGKIEASKEIQDRIMKSVIESLSFYKIKKWMELCGRNYLTEEELEVMLKRAIENRCITKVKEILNEFSAKGIKRRLTLKERQIILTFKFEEWNTDDLMALGDLVAEGKLGLTESERKEFIQEYIQRYETLKIKLEKLKMVIKE